MFEDKTIIRNTSSRHTFYQVLGYDEDWSIIAKKLTQTLPKRASDPEDGIWRLKSENNWKPDAAGYLKYLQDQNTALEGP